MDRRTCLKLIGAAGIASVAGGTQARAAQSEADAGDSCAILMDLTACRGCRTCEQVCAYVNELPEPTDLETPPAELPNRSTTETQWTVVNAYKTSGGQVFVKQQCRHCNTPACATACLTKALIKTPEGPVVWREDKCMGCRYCMLSCPFDMLKFEYDSPTPRIQKCRMCWDKLKEGEVPACVDFCSGQALTFGKRSELLKIAHARIAQEPEKYVSHIFGEREAGGTGVLYLSPVPFEELGFPANLGETAYPEYTRSFLSSVPIVLTLWPAFLWGLNRAARPSDGENHP